MLTQVSHFLRFHQTGGRIHECQSVLLASLLPFYQVIPVATMILFDLWVLMEFLVEERSGEIDLG